MSTLPFSEKSSTPLPDQFILKKEGADDLCFHISHGDYFHSLLTELWTPEEKQICDVYY